ncbi:HIT domain-containing protein [Marivibrio halodurans]|uniref:HIT domain-containing protein n=1 Tax=Marivibrio halodurans TaxID=2039722 RepID=A0A8J7RYR7_9PROT|nr:HIT family protein [Marivibrio halodurans]MBP5857192.1 HIT domain-containing protein [Marivibrio halodurans]
MTGPTSDDFMLHPRLAEDTAMVKDLTLCRLLLMRDARFPWMILVPRRADIREIHDLTQADQRQLLAEVTTLSKAMEREWHADKMNVAALGNMVPQLHIHVIARFDGDAAWPGPVWGAGTATPYEEARLTETLTRLNAALHKA